MSKKKKKKKKLSNYVKIWIVKDILPTGILKKIPKRLIKRISGKNVAYVMDILMMMVWVIFYIYKKSQTTKKLNVVFVEKPII